MDRPLLFLLPLRTTWDRLQDPNLEADFNAQNVISIFHISSSHLLQISYSFTKQL